MTACGEDDEPDGTLPSAGSEQIEYSASGGIAGISNSVEISATGEVRVRVDGQPAPATGVSAKLVADARSSAAAVDFPDEDPGPVSTQCADCFSYRLVYGDQAVTADDTTVEDTEGLAEAIAALNAIVDEASAR